MAATEHEFMYRYACLSTKVEVKLNARLSSNRTEWILRSATTNQELARTRELDAMAVKVADLILIQNLNSMQRVAAAAPLEVKCLLPHACKRVPRHCFMCNGGKEHTY